MISKRKLLNLVLEMIELEKEMNTDATVLSDRIEGWDSLTHLSILVSLDKELGGKTSSIDSLAICSNTDDLFDVLRSNGLAA